MTDDLFAVAISGSPRAPSKSKTLAELALSELKSLGCRTQLIDVAVMPAEALVVRSESPAISEAIAAVGRARIVVAASPTYRALYTGVLKCFFDLMPQEHLSGKSCVGLQTGIAPQHALSAEYGFRPLFASLNGVPMSAIYALDSDFSEGEPSAELAASVRAAMQGAVNAARAS
ncbi:MAG TPA: NAD(P)H-dependent oxidoreductase [Dehalococcoidia bacterium]